MPPRLPLLLATLLSATACKYPVDVGGDGDAAFVADAGPDAPPITLCDVEGTSSVTGTGPAGALAGYQAFVRVRGGFCTPSLEVVLAPVATLQEPYPPRTLLLTAQTPVDVLTISKDWAGSVDASLRDPDGGSAAAGTLQVAQATPTLVVPTRLRATAVFDDAGWQVTASIDAPYCTLDSCP